MINLCNFDSSIINNSLIPEKKIKNAFPDPSSANKDGLLAIGGDLDIQTLIQAYSEGIFPWYDNTSPILWWSPDPRFILIPEQILISKSLAQTIKSGRFECHMDTVFKEVIHACSIAKRKGQSGTWITTDMEKAYIDLHYSGYAHSVEIFYKGELAGGLYGISLGGAFFGESMFQIKRDASKVALHCLVQLLKKWEFDFIDAQVPGNHMKSLGAKEIPRDRFLAMLKQSLEKPTRKGKWEFQKR